MSFSGEIKEEIARRMPGEAHCMRAELAALIRLAGTVRTEEGNESVRVSTENVSLAKKYLRLVRQAFGISVDLTIRRRSSGRSNQYVIQMEARGDDRAKVLCLIRETAGWEKEGFEEALFSRNCCQRSYIRGAFLAAGSMSNPDRSYHLEIVCRSLQTAVGLQRVIADFGLHARTIKRKNRHIVYLKDSEEIVDLLNVMGAHRSLMALENVRIMKDMKNCANRQSNCDTANISKMVKASVRQTEDIRCIIEHRGLEKLPKPLQEMARIRLEYPDVSLQELGTYLDPPVGKSGVNHRLRRLGEIAKELRDGKENE